MYYSATIIQMSGVYDKSTAVWLSSLTSTINFAGTFVGLYAVERAGRRKVTLISLGAVVFALALLGAGFQIGAGHSPSSSFFSTDPRDVDCTALSECNACIASSVCGFCFDDSSVSGANGTCLAANTHDAAIGSITSACVDGTRAAEKIVWASDWCPSPYSWMTLVGLCLFLLAFAPGMGPMPWTINAELYPMQSRSVCVSVATSFCWFFNMLISFTFLTLVRLLTKQGAFYLYSSMAAIGFVYLFIALPETKGKSLEDTALLFGDNSRRSSDSSNGTSRSKPV